MSIMPALSAWITTAIVFGLLDWIWLSQMTPRLYQPLLGDLLAPKTNVRAAAAFYLIYVTCLCALAVIPALERGGLARAALFGGLVGLVAYAAYDLTNHATLRGWDIRVTLADMAWGTVASAAAATAAYWVASRF
jgi:uncharacterized membrane protein